MNPFYSVVMKIVKYVCGRIANLKKMKFHTYWLIYNTEKSVYIPCLACGLCKVIQ